MREGDLNSRTVRLIGGEGERGGGGWGVCVGKGVCVGRGKGGGVRGVGRV